jgi:hypothetical protein
MDHRCRDDGGDHVAVDPDPGPLSRKGQLVLLARYIASPAEYLAPSTLDVLREVVASLLTQRRSRDAGSRLWPPAGGRIGWDTRRSEWGPRVGLAGPAAAVAGVADPALVRSTSILGVDRARLTDRAPLGKIRFLHVRDECNLADVIDLTIPAGLPRIVDRPCPAVRPGLAAIPLT